MTSIGPPNSDQVSSVVSERLAALEDDVGLGETLSIEWRGSQRIIPVIAMPVDLLSYNPSTHRVRAQRSLDAAKDRAIDDDPYGDLAQAYLHHLLMGDPADPSKTDPSFEALKEDLAEHGQTEPGIITRNGILINGNTRRAALKESGARDIRVAVLPTDAGLDDLASVELSLQLRREHKREYSFMNFLLAIDESVLSGQRPADIQKEFRIKAAKFERSRWILDFVNDAIERSRTDSSSLRLIDFEQHQGKLEELYRKYAAAKPRDPQKAEAIREQRLLALVLDKSKTDLRLIEDDFVEKFAKKALELSGPIEVESTSGGMIPGTSIPTTGPSPEIQKLRSLATKALRARAVTVSAGAPANEKAEAQGVLKDLDAVVDTGLDRAGKQTRIQKKRFAAVERLEDVHDILELALVAVVEAKSTNNLNPDDLDDALSDISRDLVKLAQLIGRGDSGPGEGLAWLRSLASKS